MTTPAPLTHDRAAENSPKVQLVGAVAGVHACELVTNNAQIVVGSGGDCDLVVMDPLVKRKALRLVHNKEHAGVHEHCGSCWTLETLGGARAYVNGDLVDRSRLAFGDVIALGCHELVFSEHDARARDRRTNVAIDDLCASLIAGGKTPKGFLQGLPSWRDWVRSRKAAACGLAVALLLLLVQLLSPSAPRFENTHPAMEIAMLGDRLEVSGDQVRSLKAVARKQFQAASAVAAPELPAAKTEVLKAYAARPIKADLPHAPLPTPLANERVVEDAGPQLAALALPSDHDPVVVERATTAALGTSAPRRRLRTERPLDPQLARADAMLGQAKVKTDKGDIASRSFTQYARQAIERGAKRAAAPDFANARAENLAALQYKPSPVTFEQYRGQRIPIARVPEQLATLAAGTGAAGVALDGNVSDAEVSVSFKTGRFRVHGPGSPPEADPATYCYVAKTQRGGRDFLYVSFVCSDPNLGALVLNEPGGTPGLAWDDSIEVFLDFNQDRADYHHIIVNARGSYFASYCPNADAGINGKGTPWDSGLEVKTTIDQSAGRWVCEVMVPYDHLPQVPGKGAEIPFNVCRNFRGQHSNNALQNWFAVYEGAMTNYHHPRLFGKLAWP